MPSRHGNTLEAGQISPEVEVVLADGTRRSLASILESGPALFAFFKASCPTCQLTVPYLRRLDGSAAQVIAISQDQPAVARRFVAEFGAPDTVAFDPSADNYPASNAFGITHVPSMFLIEPDRRITWSSVGFFKRDLADLGERLGKPVIGPQDKVPEAKSG